MLAGACAGLLVPGFVLAGSSQSTLLVRATVAPWLEHRVLHQPSELMITKADLKRGFKDVHAGTIALVSTNNAGGYMVSVFCGEAPFLESVNVMLDGASLPLPCSGAVELLQPRSGLPREVKTISYRFRLSPDARAQRYSWPLSLMISAL